MSVSIRLSRGGSKKRPYYKVVVSNSRSPRDGKYLEQVGTYNPLLAKDDAARVRLTEDRVRYWLGVGAQPTDRVARMLDKAGIKERAATSNPQKGEPGQKAKDRAEDKADKAREAEEAAAAAAAAPEPEAAPEPQAAPEVEATADGGAEVPAETPSEVPAEAPAEAPASEPAEAPAQEEPLGVPAESPVETPPPAETNEATPNSDAGDAATASGESAQDAAEG